MPLIDVGDLTTARTGDTLPGSGGMTTSSTTNQTVLKAYGEDTYTGSVKGSAMVGTPAEHPIPWWLALGVLLVVLKFAAEKAGEEKDFANVRIGVLNIIIITASAIFGITLAKWIFGVYVIPGLSAIVEAA